MFKTRRIFVLLIVLIFLCSAVFESCSKEKERILQLKIITDETFRAHYEWEEIVKEVVKQASLEFDEQLGIRLEIKAIEEVKVEHDFSEIDSKIKKLKMDLEVRLFNVIIYELLKWEGANKAEVEIDWLKARVDSRDCDITVYFSGKDYGMISGYVDDILGRWVLVSCNDKEEDSQRMVHILIHELGHIFGAVHCFDRSSVMNRSSKAYKTVKFDKINKKLILKHKWRNFREQSEKN